MKKLITIFLSLSILTIANAQSKKTTSLEQLDKNLQEIYNNSKLPGFSIVLASDEKTLFQHSYGFADIKTKKPFSNHSVQNIGSVSKTFIAMALMQAVDQGLLKLDDDINKYLPFKVINPHFLNDKITIRHLANHSSGIIDDAKYDKAYSLTNTNKLDESKYSEDEYEFLQSSLGNEITDESVFLESVLSSKGKLYTTESFAKFKPGSKYIYTNIGAALAAYVLEKASGIGYEKFIKTNIFLPLNMSHSSFTLDSAHQGDFVSRYFSNGIEVPDYHLITKADGAIITSTTDMAKYMQELLKASHRKGTLLTDKSYQTMIKRIPVGEDFASIFWDVKDNGDLNHAGADPGIMTYLYIKPNKDLAIFFMTNILALEYPKTKRSFALVMRAIKNHKWD